MRLACACKILLFLHGIAGTQPNPQAKASRAQDNNATLTNLDNVERLYMMQARYDLESPLSQDQLNDVANKLLQTGLGSGGGGGGGDGSKSLSLFLAVMIGCTVGPFMAGCFLALWSVRCFFFKSLEGLSLLTVP